MFSVDGIEWTMPCKISRTAKMTASDISGLLLDKSWFNDVLGTYMVYELTIAAPRHKMQDYFQMYEILTQPVDAHSFVLPYNGSTITLTAKVEEIQDTYHDLGDLGNYWYNSSFRVVSIAPSKTMSLEDVIARGMSPLPDVQSVPAGAVMQLRSGEWVELTMTDGGYYQWTESTKTLAAVPLTDADEVAY